MNTQLRLRGLGKLRWILLPLNKMDGFSYRGFKN